MTGSSTEIAHAVSPQWSALLEAASSYVDSAKSQPEKWWVEQADRLRAEWTASGLPTMRLEAWKYTSLVSLHDKRRVVKMAGFELKAPDGVVFSRLSEMAAKTGEAQHARLKELFQVASVFEFENIARSLVVDPYVVLIPDGFRSDVPIEMNWVAAPGESWSFGAVGVVVGASSDVSLLERYGHDSSAMTLTTSIAIGADAKVSHLRLQCGVGADAVIASSRAWVATRATYENVQVSFGAELSRENLLVELQGESAQSIADGVFIGRGRQVLDHHTDLVHRVGTTTSGQVYKGILSDESRGVFNGRIAIAKNASGSNSSQMNRNLLLSKKVEIDTKPQLEIDNDDVKAAHGATIGRLDAEHIFYLRSRGIGLSEAVEILSRGFAFEALSRMTSSSLRPAGEIAVEAGLRGLSWESL